MRPPNNENSNAIASFVNSLKSISGTIEEFRIPFSNLNLHDTVDIAQKESEDSRYFIKQDFQN